MLCPYINHQILFEIKANLDTNSLISLLFSAVSQGNLRFRNPEIVTLAGNLSSHLMYYSRFLTDN